MRTSKLVVYACSLALAGTVLIGGVAMSLAADRKQVTTHHP
jgi:hypothetical protein